MGVKVPVAGLYSSALAKVLPWVVPPAISTLPLLSSVAVWHSRAVFRLPVGVKVPVAGSYSSALAKCCRGSVASRNQHHAIVQQRRRVIGSARCSGCR